MNKSENSLDKVYCSYGHNGEANWIIPLGYEYTSNLEEADLALFGGGKDIDPSFYKEQKGSRTDTPSARDKAEYKDFQEVQKLRKEGKKIKTLGICRGAQLACALSGGKVIQDVSNHCGDHKVSTFDKQSLIVNSIHHQMMFPYTMKKDDYKILAWSTTLLSGRYMNGMNRAIWLPQSFKETEVIYFANTDSLAIQCHPEMMYRSKRAEGTMDWMQNIFTKFIKNEL